MLLLEDKLSYVFNDCRLDVTDELYVDEFDEICDTMTGEIENNDRELYEQFGGYSVFCGASKVAIVPNNYGYVIKIPFNGSGEYDVYEDEDGNTEKTEFLFNEFTGADVGNNWDYCLAETIIYDFAEQEGFGKYFAKTSYWKKSRYDYPLYIQEKVEIDYYRTASEKSLKSVSKVKKELNDKCLHTPISNDDWSGIFVDYYGEAEFKKFMNFLVTEDINDLHNGNLGYRLSDGAPVIFDYSGYRG